VSYHKNYLLNNAPTPVSEAEGGYAHYQEKVEGKKVRARSESFKDHFSQATIFWNSMTSQEKKHIQDAFIFEVGKVKDKNIKQQVVEMFAKVNVELATKIAENVGVNPPTTQGNSDITKVFPSLSQENTIRKPDTRKIGVILADNFDSGIIPILDGLKAKGLKVEIISDKLGFIKAKDNGQLEVNHTFLTASSVFFDALFAAGGSKTDEKFTKDAKYFINEAYMHYKPVGIAHEGANWLQENNMISSVGVVPLENMETFIEKFVSAIAAHRHWDRNIY